MNKQIGICGNCGGRVTVPENWMGMYPPTPKCESCGATPRSSEAERMPMNPPIKTRDEIADHLIDKIRRAQPRSLRDGGTADVSRHLGEQPPVASLPVRA